MTRQYSNTSKVMTLSSGINTSATSITVNDASGLPVTFPYALALDYEQANVEIVLVTAAASNVLTITRAQEDTAASSHATGATAVHVSTALDHQNAANHVDATQNIHGVGSGNAIVGTGTSQTLTNKSMSGASNTFSAIPGSALTGAITVATIAVANVTGDWPIDTRSTGNLPIDTRTTGNLPIDTRSTGSIPIDTRTTGNLPIDTRSTGNLPATRITSPYQSIGIQQNQAGVPGADVTVTATTPTVAAVRVTSKSSAPGLALKRDSSTSTGNLLEWLNESNSIQAKMDRAFIMTALGFKVGSVQLDDVPRVSVKQSTGVSLPNGSTVDISFSATVENRGGWTINSGSGLLTPPVSGFYAIAGNLLVSGGTGGGLGVFDANVVAAGNTYRGGRTDYSSSYGSTAISFCIPVKVTTGDTIKVTGFQNGPTSGASGFIEALSAWYIGPAA